MSGTVVVLRLKFTPPGNEVADELGQLAGVRHPNGVGGTEFLRQLEPRGHEIHRDDARSAHEARRHDGGQPNAARAEHCDRVARGELE